MARESKVSRAWLDGEGNPAESGMPAVVTGRRFDFGSDLVLDAKIADVKVDPNILIAYALNHIVGDSFAGAAKVAEEEGRSFAEVAYEMAQEKFDALVEGNIRTATEAAVGGPIGRDAAILAMATGRDVKDVRTALRNALTELPDEEARKAFLKAKRAHPAYKQARVKYDLEQAQKRAAKVSGESASTEGLGL